MASTNDRNVLEIPVDREDRRWLLLQEIRSRRSREQATDLSVQRMGPFLSISRESGAGGGRIARLVGEKLGWKVLDKELVEFMAEHYRLPRGELESLDEATVRWAAEVFGAWLRHPRVTPEDYLACLEEVVLLAAHERHVVLVGRGAQFLLPRVRGLAVRLVAPPEFRIQQIVCRKNFNREDAERFMIETDRGRGDFIRRHFQRDVADPGQYDLVINVEKFGTEGAAGQIVAALGSLFPESARV